MLSLAGFEARVLYRALVRAVDAYLGEVARGAQVLLPREEARLLLADDAAAATATATTAGASALSPWTPLDTSAARSFTWLHAVAVFDVGGAAGSTHAADGAASPSVRLADVRKEAVGVLKRRFTSAPTEHEAQRKALSGGYQMLRSLKGRAKALRAMSYVPHSDAVTAGVRVVVAARYLPPHALPPQMPRTAPSFAYDITIINVRAVAHARALSCGACCTGARLTGARCHATDQQPQRATAAAAVGDPRPRRLGGGGRGRWRRGRDAAPGGAHRLAPLLVVDALELVRRHDARLVPHGGRRRAASGLDGLPCHGGAVRARGAERVVPAPAAAAAVTQRQHRARALSLGAAFALSPARRRTMKKRCALLPHERQLLESGHLREVTHSNATSRWLEAVPPVAADDADITLAVGDGATSTATSTSSSDDDGRESPDGSAQQRMTRVYRPMGDAELQSLLAHGALPDTQPYQTIVEGRAGFEYASRYLRGTKKVDSQPSTVVEFTVPTSVIQRLFAMQHKAEDGVCSMGLGHKAGRGLELFNAALRDAAAATSGSSYRIVLVKRRPRERATDAPAAARGSARSKVSSSSSTRTKVSKP